MANHPNRSRTYHGVSIIKSSQIHTGTKRPLYALEGAVSKRADATPLLTSGAAAREYVDGIMARRHLDDEAR